MDFVETTAPWDSLNLSRFFMKLPKFRISSRELYQGLYSSLLIDEISSGADDDHILVNS